MKKSKNITLLLAISIFVTTLPMVFSMSCPHGLQPVIHMTFRPDTSVATVGSNIQIYCNASTIGLGDIRNDRFQLSIHDDTPGNKALNSNETRTKTVECTFSIENVSYSDAKVYTCVAQLNGGSAGCSRKAKMLIVKDCTNVKDSNLSFSAVLTERMTISYQWKYRLESCDRGFLVYWSDKGPVDLKSSSKRLPLNVTSYEITDLERNSRREYWVGMSVETTKGFSKIFRVENPLQPICTSNKEGLFSVNASVTSNNTISISWKYSVESCDEGFVLYWSGDGPVSKSTSLQKLINRNTTYFELKSLEPDTKYWIGMAVRTTKGLSKIHAFNGSLVTERNSRRQYWVGMSTETTTEATKMIDHPHKDNVTMPIIIFVVLIICLLAIAGTVIWCVISRRKRKFQDTVPVVQMTSGAAQNLGILYPDTEIPATVEIPPLSPIVPLDDVFEEDGEIETIEEKDAEFDYLTVVDEWEVSRELISVTSTRLGTGQFGIVKKGTFRTRNENGVDIDLPIAVKVLKDGATEIDHSDLLTELRILKFVNTLPHPNILKLIGACTSEQPIFVITEYCSKGNLNDVLKKYREILKGTIPAKSEPKLTNEQLLSIAVDVACGMEHLMKMKFVHRDLAARNILVTESWTAKISDFGLARETSSGGEYIKSRRNLLPVKWTAIEALVEGKFTSASDVWSFGVLLWEISNIGGSPYKGISPHDIMSHVGSGGRLGKPERCSPYLYSIMKECWETLPEKRPTFTVLHEKLSTMLEKAEITYINVEFMNDAKEGHFERYTSA